MPRKALPSCVKFHFLQTKPALNNRGFLKGFVWSLFKKEQTAVSSLDYIFSTDEYLLEINKRFLDHDYYTDVISFILANKNEPVKGEIYISLERVRENAGKMEQYLNTELLRVIFHGALHLCGYKDKTARDSKLMRSMEDEYIQLYHMELKMFHV
jgi:probable rRNA maturation factor